jgi:GNAT superfamily N-acetyltransferase
MFDISIIESTFFTMCRIWGRLNRSLSAAGSVHWMSSGVDSADLNMAWSETPLKLTDEGALETVKQFFESQKLPFWFWVFPCAQASITLELLKGAGFSFVHATPCMLIDLSDTNVKEVNEPSICLRRVEHEKDLALWRDVSFAGFDFPPETFEQFDRFTGTFSLQSDCPYRLFLAFRENQPVATSLLLLTEKAAGIYFVTTLADHRKKGIGSAVTAATLQYAKSSKMRFATLQASPDGLTVYQRLGFKEYCRVDIYSL